MLKKCFQLNIIKKRFLDKSTCYTQIFIISKKIYYEKMLLKLHKFSFKISFCYFKHLEKIFNKNSGGFVCFHDLSPNVFESQVKSISPAKPIPLDELIERYKSGKSTKNCFSLLLTMELEML